MPGVVATINGEPIRYQELAEECLLRYGEEVLEVEISHLLLQQALAKANVDGHASRTSTPRSPTRPSWPAWSTRRASPTSTSGSKSPRKSRAFRRTNTCATRSGRRPR